MCLIIHKPAGKVVPPDWIKEAISQNPHGWGVMSAKEGRLWISKGLHGHKLTKALERHGDGELFLHLRFATHGDKSVDNCHPFVICNNRFAVMHNGVIGIDTKEDEKRSDTWHYCQKILTPALNTYSFDSTLCDGIAKSCGGTNKLAILRHDGKSMIVGRNHGDEVDGFWLSNSYSIEPCVWAWSCQKDVKPKNKWSHQKTDLENLAWLPENQLEDFCENYPDLVAEAIRDYFTWSTLERDYR